MEFYLVNIALTIIWGIALNDLKNVNGKKLLCVLCALQWIILSGFRDYSVGADTYQYFSHYQSVDSYQWNYVLEQTIAAFSNTNALNDPGYTLLVKLFRLTGLDYRGFLIFVATAFMAALAYSVYKNSPDPCVSFILFSCLFYSFFAITGIRQTLATALVVLLGYEFIKRRRLVPFLLVTIAAFLLHKSALVFAPFYFLCNIKLTRRSLIVAACVALGIFAYREQIIGMIMSGSLQFDAFADEKNKSAPLSMTVYFVGLFCMIWWKKGVLSERFPQSSQWVNALLLACILFPMVFVVSSSMRVVQYYSLFTLFLLPALTECFSKKEEAVLAKMLCVAVLVLAFVSTNPYFRFEGFA